MATLALPAARKYAGTRLPPTTRFTCHRTSSLASDSAVRHQFQSRSPSRRITDRDPNGRHARAFLPSQNASMGTSSNTPNLRLATMPTRQSLSEAFAALSTNPARIPNSRTTSSSIMPWLRPCTPSNAANGKNPRVAAHTRRHTPSPRKTHSLLEPRRPSRRASFTTPAQPHRYALNNADELIEATRKETTLSLLAAS